MSIKLNVIFSLVALFLFLQTNNEKEITLVDKVSLDTESTFLKRPLDFIVSDNKFLWIEEFNIKVFSKSGNFLFKHEKIGSGPGEYKIIDSIALKDGFIFIFDNKSKKISKYKIEESEFEYLGETPVKVLNTRNFTVGNNGHYYFLLSHTLNDRQPSISEFDEDGQFIGSYGNQPDLAALSRGLRGGGIVSLGDVIYYSYLGDPKLYYLNTDSKTSSYLQDIPDYFTKADPNEVVNIERSLSKLIRYAFRISQINNITKHKDYIFQVVSDGGVGMGREKQSYIEAWKSNAKIASEVSVSSQYVTSDGDYIYSLVDDFESKLEASSRKKELINKYTF